MTARTSGDFDGRQFRIEGFEEHLVEGVALLGTVENEGDVTGDARL
jgi:hypothetical protein